MDNLELQVKVDQKVINMLQAYLPFCYVLEFDNIYQNIIRFYERNQIPQEVKSVERYAMQLTVLLIEKPEIFGFRINKQIFQNQNYSQIVHKAERVFDWEKK